MKKSTVDTEPIITELVAVIFQIESQLKIIEAAFNENQVNGDKLREKIRKILDWLVVGSRIQDKLHQCVCSYKPQSFEFC